jgi:hypothetical protein
MPTTAVAGFVALPGAWETMSINGVRVPGLVLVTGKVARKDDTIDIPGLVSVTQTVLGYAPAQFTATVTLWTDQQLGAYQALVRKFRPLKSLQRSTAAQAVKVQHPAVQLCGITDLTIYEMSTPEHTGKGIWRATLDLREFMPFAQRHMGVMGMGLPPGGNGPTITAPQTGPSSDSSWVDGLRGRYVDQNNPLEDLGLP